MRPRLYAYAAFALLVYNATANAMRVTENPSPLVTFSKLYKEMPIVMIYVNGVGAKQLATSRACLKSI